ncbi:MAG: YkgJ family cysteine cluster protein [Candidatus Omnitrophota bacterium]
MAAFQCQRCNACCRQPGFVYLKEGDAERLAAYLEMDIYQFTEAQCLLMDRQHLALKKRPNETCLFEGANGCTVYAARPAQCRDFPLSWQTERSQHYCEGMKKV